MQQNGLHKVRPVLDRHCHQWTPDNAPSSADDAVYPKGLLTVQTDKGSDGVGVCVVLTFPIRVSWRYINRDHVRKEQKRGSRCSGEEQWIGVSTAPIASLIPCSGASDRHRQWSVRDMIRFLRTRLYCVSNCIRFLRSVPYI